MHSYWQSNRIFESYWSLLIHGNFGMDIHINNSCIQYSTLSFQTPINILFNPTIEFERLCWKSGVDNLFQYVSWYVQRNVKGSYKSIGYSKQVFACKYIRPLVYIYDFIVFVPIQTQNGIDWYLDCKTDSRMVYNACLLSYNILRWLETYNYIILRTKFSNWWRLSKIERLLIIIKKFFKINEKDSIYVNYLIFYY